jgi:hypothetical protein
MCIQYRTWEYESYKPVEKDNVYYILEFVFHGGYTNKTYAVLEHPITGEIKELPINYLKTTK